MLRRWLAIASEGGRQWLPKMVDGGCRQWLWTKVVDGGLV
ncbi:uncharacterized protein G2W53_018393 [Senna tora]|uniref:Uncharacterized protein n=1 Tax=Senna tora TaxID=362788 RepID=A0A834TSY9_9FABA|nr:uncharacterized protein G2W53_018393 [Senna tora]